MDYRTITSLMLRVAGVLILVQFITSIPQTIANLLHFGGSQAQGLDSLWLSAMAPVLPLAIGLVLIYFPSAITNRVVRTVEPVDANGFTESLLPVALACLGVYFMCAALYDGVYWFSKVRLHYVVADKLRWVGPPPTLMPDEFAGIASTLTQFIIGIALTFGSKGIGKLVMRMRS